MSTVPYTSLSTCHVYHTLAVLVMVMIVMMIMIMMMLIVKIMIRRIRLAIKIRTNILLVTTALYVEILSCLEHYFIPSLTISF